MYETAKPSDSTINIRHFLIMALGGNAFLHDIIEAIYKEKEWEYYEHYRNSGFVNDVVISTFTTKSEEKMRQVVGIVEWCYSNDNFEILYKIIKKGYKFTYRYVEQRTHIDLQEFNHSYMKKKGGSDKLSDLELFNNNIVALYLCYRNNKDCELRNVSGEIFQNGLKDTYLNCMVKELNFNDKQKQKHKEELTSLYENYPVPHKFDNQMNISRLFEYAIERKTEEVVRKDMVFDPVKARSRAFKEPYIKEIGALSGWVKTLGINEMDLTESTPFSKEDMDIVFMEYLIAKNENGINEEQRDLFIVACLWIQALAKHFNEAKRLYLDQAKQEYYIDMKKREDVIKEKEKIFKDKEQDSKKEQEERNERIKKLEEELRMAQSSIRDLQEKNKEMKDYSKEVHALRTYLYEQENKALEIHSPLTIEQMAEAIQSHSIAIFGGHPNWKQKIKEVLTEVAFIDVDELNKDISFIDRLDVIFVNTSVFNHSFYRKLMSRLNKNQTLLCYLDGNSNVEKTIQKIYQEVCLK